VSDQKYDDRIDIFKDPQEYRGIKFYPLKIMDYEYTDSLYRLFGYPKKYFSMRDPVIYKMTYLKFLLITIQQSDPYFKDVDVGEELIDFLKYITKKNNIFLDITGTLENINTFDYKIIIDGVSFSANDFDTIREIVLRQNGISVEYIEAYDDRLEESLRFLHRGKPSYTFKDKVFSFAVLVGKTIDEIKNCTLYEMENILESVGSVIAFKMHTIPLTEVSKEYQLPSYIAHLDNKSRYDEILIGTDSFKQESDYFKSPENLSKKKN
jgi:hypothetical protein